MIRKAKSVDEYILDFSVEVQSKLQCIRQIIFDHAPNVTESISYGLPAYHLNKKPLVYFGGFAKHIGFYATPTGHDKFAKELSVYKQGRGSVQFPLSQPLPVDLIIKIVKFRVKENGI